MGAGIHQTEFVLWWQGYVDQQLLGTVGLNGGIWAQLAGHHT